MASVRGTVVVDWEALKGDVHILGDSAPLAFVVRLTPVDGASPAMDALCNASGRFEFSNAAPGWHILSVATVGGGSESIRAVQVGSDGSADVGSVAISDQMWNFSNGITKVLTVCEALENHQTIQFQHCVIVGIFKSGMDETLRLDCPFQLMTGQVGWPSSIGLTRPSMPPEALRDEIEKKREEVLKSGPPGAQPRPERVVGLYGIFATPSGLTSAPCCRASVETTSPPARLFGVTEKDLRVVR